MKLKISIAINVLLFISLLFALANVNRYYRHNQYHRNKMLKYQYETIFKVLYPDSSLHFFQNKWGKELKKQASNSYLVDFDIVEKEPFFVENEFNASDSQIHSLNLQFDSEGNLKTFFLEDGP